MKFAEMKKSIKLYECPFVQNVWMMKIVWTRNFHFIHFHSFSYFFFLVNFYSFSWIFINFHSIHFQYYNTVWIMKMNNENVSKWKFLVCCPGVSKLTSPSPVETGRFLIQLPHTFPFRLQRISLITLWSALML